MEPGDGIGKRVAFFGGSFDPPHQGHLAVARAAQTALALDTVLFAPVGYQPLKPEGSSASFEDRVAMTRLAVAEDPGFAVSLVDAPEGLTGPNYTANSLIRLRDELGPNVRLFILVGADSFLTLRRWHRAAEIPLLASLIVASRPGLPLSDLQAALPDGLSMDDYPDRPEGFGGLSGSSVAVRGYLVRNPAGAAVPLYVLPELHVDISASQIRKAVESKGRGSAGESALLSPAVREYISSHGLYL